MSQTFSGSVQLQKIEVSYQMKHGFKEWLLKEELQKQLCRFNQNKLQQIVIDGIEAIKFKDIIELGHNKNAFLKKAFYS